MTTIKDAIILGSKFLEERMLDTPALDASTLLQKVLQCTPTDIIIKSDQHISSEEKRSLMEMLEIRASGVPISHILGKRDFWDLTFSVNSNVLDPRPDSETLISATIDKYQNKKAHLAIADYGTGSGCLIITLANHYKYSEGTAFEKSPKAYRTALQNIKNHSLQGRIKLHLGSWAKSEGKFDIIISNPPYIRKNDIKTLQKEVRFNEPRLALDGGIAGMDCYKEIFGVIQRCLKPNGLAFIEIGRDQDRIHSFLPKFKLKLLEYRNDLSGQKRCIIIRHNAN